MADFHKSEVHIYAKNNTTSFADFGQYVTGLRQLMKRQYDRNVNRDLSRQNWQKLFKRNLTSVLKQAYEDSLAQLQSVYYEPQELQAEKGELIIEALKPFDGFVEELVQYALHKHRTSCALSNFPDEHRPSSDYMVEVIQETAKDWQVFVTGVETIVSRSCLTNLKEN